MLKSLKISNFAIIDNLEINFGKGFSIITGETGAGKSIMMGALSLILGGKADLKAVRNTERKTVIEATFGIEEYGLKPLFDACDIDYDAEECIMRREISASGRTRAFINDMPVTLQTMRDISMHLVDIHSQHSNLLLSQADYQLGIIDSIIDDKCVKEQYAARFASYTALCSRLSHLKAENRKRKEEEDYIRFQLDRLQELKLTEGEDEELLAEERTLSNVAEIKEALWESEEMLSGENRSVISDVSQMRQRMSRIAELYSDAGEIAERMESILIDLKDINRTIAAMQGSLVDNPDELARVQERLNAIYELETKHKVGSVDELIALQRGYQEQLAAIDNGDEEIAALEAMVQEVNETQVAPQDRLSDHVYQYDNETHEIFRADRAEEHMQAKEEAKDTAEIPKDAVADQPKDKAEKGDKEKTSLKERLEDKKKEAKEIEKKSPEKALDKSKKKEQAL